MKVVVLQVLFSLHSENESLYSWASALLAAEFLLASLCFSSFSASVDSSLRKTVREEALAVCYSASLVSDYVLMLA
jgi:hypothetical protein